MSMNPSRLSLSTLAAALCALAGTAVLAPATLRAQTATTAEAPWPDTRALRSRTKVTVNFVNADVEAVTRAFAAMIERQIAVDPRVKGSITVYSEQPQTIREAYAGYLAALRGLGFAMVESAGLLKVVPEADAKLQAGTVVVGEATARADQVLTQIFSLRYENATNLVAVLRPLITANNTINISPGTNAVVITDYADNLQRLGRIISALDQPSQTDVEIVPLKHAVAADLALLMQRLADAGAAAGAPGTAAGANVTVAADSRSNSLIVRAPNRARLAATLATIDKLDRPAQGAGAQGNLWVVHLRNADATRLATVLRAAFTSTGTSSGTSGPPGLGAAALTATAPAPLSGAMTPGAAATAPLVAAAQPTTGGFVQADPATNSLIITAPEPLYRQVRAMIEQLDTRRAQVYIESMIVEVSGDNAADFGFQWQGLIGSKGDKNLIGLGTNFGTSGNIIGLQTGAAAGQVSLGEGLNIGLIRNYGGVYALSAIAPALQ